MLRSWNNEVTNTTIYNCFRKPTLVVSSPISLPTPIIPSGLAELYKKVTDAGNIQDAMVISNFLNPIEEEEAKEEEDEHTVGEEEVLQEHLDLQSNQDDDEDDEQIAQPVYLARDAKQALQILIRFTEGQDSLSTSYLRALERLESEIDPGIKC
jgi:hypothetical protein